MKTESDLGKIRAELTHFALEIRPLNTINGSLDEPELVHEYEYNDGEETHSRIKIYLRSRGCTCATCTMCPMPHETAYGKESPITSENYLEQFNSVFRNRSINDYDIICVYNGGNWFADKELPPEVRKGIYQAIAESEADAMMVQSLPQFITPKTIEEAKKILGDKKLIVGIGLQSADNDVRHLCVNTTCTKQQFERATKLLVDNGYSVETYIMIKPPFLTENEAVQDVVNSIQYLDSLGLKNASICPTRISPHTVAWELAERGLYRSPSLWTVVDILKEIHQKGLRIRVACLDIDGKDTETLYPRGCIDCSVNILTALRKYNNSGDITEIDILRCDTCHDNHLVELSEVNDILVKDRVVNFVRSIREK